MLSNKLERPSLSWSFISNHLIMDENPDSFQEHWKSENSMTFLLYYHSGRINDMVFQTKILIPPKISAINANLRICRDLLKSETSTFSSSRHHHRPKYVEGEGILHWVNNTFWPPIDLNTFKGQDNLFHINVTHFASPTPSKSYQWKRDGDPLETPPLSEWSN